MTVVDVGGESPASSGRRSSTAGSPRPLALERIATASRQRGELAEAVHVVGHAAYRVGNYIRARRLAEQTLSPELLDAVAKIARGEPPDARGSSTLSPATRAALEAIARGQTPGPTANPFGLSEELIAALRALHHGRH